MQMFRWKNKRSQRQQRSKARLDTTNGVLDDKVEINITDEGGACVPYPSTGYIAAGDDEKLFPNPEFKHK